MVKVVISQHSYPHDAGHSEVSTPIKHYKIDIEYQVVNCKKECTLPKGIFLVFGFLVKLKFVG